MDKDCIELVMDLSVTIINGAELESGIIGPVAHIVVRSSVAFNYSRCFLQVNARQTDGGRKGYPLTTFPDKFGGSVVRRRSYAILCYRLEIREKIAKRTRRYVE